jgi:FAD/FMN-containing dehydrogenase
LVSDRLQQLTARLPGRVFRPGTDEYARATSPHNASARQRPAAVVAAQDAGDVAACLQAAAEAEWRVAVQASGHGAAGEIGADTLLLDTSRLNRVTVDADRRVVTAGAGTAMSAINQAAFAHGLLAPGGTSPDVAVTGYTAHGGVGWLTRPHGLASAALLSVDVVDGTGRPFRADDDQNSDVLWAYRGGGGAGVATAVQLRLFPASALHAGYLLWDAGHAAEVVRAWGQALPDLDSALSTSISLLHAPAAPFIPEALRGKPVVHLAAATVGGEAAMQTLRKALSALPEPAANTLGPCDAARLSGIHLDPPVAVPALGEGRWLTASAAEHALQILTAAGTDSSVAMVELRHVAAPASSVPGALTSPGGEILLHAVGAAPDPAARRRVTTGLEAVLAAARPFDTGHSAAAFRDGRTATPDALPADTRTRLASIRRRTDPHDLIVVPRQLH